MWVMLPQADNWLVPIIWLCLSSTVQRQSEDINKCNKIRLFFPGIRKDETKLKCIRPYRQEYCFGISAIW